MFRMTYSVEFHASHYLPDYDGKCSRLHGHNWVADVECQALELNKDGMVADFDVIKATVPDHDHLNNWMTAAPTTENVARELFQRLEKQGVPVVAVTIWETARGRVRYTSDPNGNAAKIKAKDDEVESFHQLVEFYEVKGVNPGFLRDAGMVIRHAFDAGVAIEKGGGS